MKKLLLSLGCLAVLFSGCGDSTNLKSPLPDTSNNALGPVAVPDAFEALGNSTVTFGPNSIFNNDTRNGANILAFDRTSTNGGTVLVNLDGSFTYTAPTGFTGADEFNYSLQNSFGTSLTTVTLQVNRLAVYVNDTAPNGDGSQAAPFATLSQALQASGPNTTIFVFSGTGNAIVGGVNLQDGQRLIGEGVGLNFNGFQVVAAGGFPQISGNIVVADGNTVSGFRLSNPAGDSITAPGITGLTVTNNQFSNVTQDGIDLTDVGGLVTIGSNTFVGIGNDAILGNWSLNGAINVSNNTFNDDNSSDPDDIIDLRSTAGTLTATVTGNLSEPAANTNAYNSAVDLLANGTGNINYSGANNTFRNTGAVAVMMINNGTGLMNTTHTALTTSGGVTTSLSSVGSGDKRHLITNSNLVDQNVNDIIIANTGAGNATVAVRTTTFNQGFFTQDGTGTYCFDAEQNITNAIAAIRAAGTFQVEELANLSERNNNAQAVTAGVVNVANGACGI